MHIYSLGPVFNRGTNFCVNIILPAIFNFPLMKATCGLILPNAMSTKSSSLTVRVVSALIPDGAPSYSLTFFKSMAKMRKKRYNVFPHRI